MAFGEAWTLKGSRTVNSDQDNEFERSLDDLRLGEADFFLRYDRFPAWIDLASTSLLEKSALANEDEGLLRKGFHNSQVCSLAQRLILSRETSLLSRLRPLWRAFGSNDESCDEVIRATQSALMDWPSDVWQSRDGLNGLKFSPALAAFIEALKAVAESDVVGVLGTAIRTCRISDERPHVGFPLILLGNLGPNLRAGLWVTPTASSSSASVDKEPVEWEELWTRVDQLVNRNNSKDNPVLPLPVWLKQLYSLNGWSVKTLESAGLGLAVQMLARQGGVTVPFGIGFTGRWVQERLRGVRDIATKMNAAKEAGVFLLFACADPIEAVPGPVAGVRLVLLPEGLTLVDVVRWVNRVCADSGVTEFRWREAQRRFQAASATTTAFSPDLRQALAEDRCPNGFVGREVALDQLRKAAAVNDQNGGRRLVAVLAPPRSGKTTLLSQFASEQSPYPIWFSFLRGQATRQNLSQLEDAIRDQIAARFGVLRLPESTTGPVDLKALLDSVSGRVDLVVDGLDEAATPQESCNVLSWLQQFPGDGVLVVGSQPLDAIRAVNCTTIPLDNGSESGHDDARQLIARFANRFARHEHLNGVAQELRQRSWVDGLVQRSGGNLWILTEFLSAVERDQAGWPNEPSELPLSTDVREYCEILVSTVLASYDDATRPHVEKFLAFRSFLKKQPLEVTDVVALADVSAPFGTWSRTGVLKGSARRIIQFDGKHCRFWSPLTHDAVRDNYQSYSQEVAARFIARIKEDQSETELGDQLLESIPMLLREVRDAGMVLHLLSDTPWLNRRMRMLAARGRPMTDLKAELHALEPLAKSDCQRAVRNMIDWLDGWGWAIDDSRDLIDQWWNAAGAVTQGWPRSEVAQGATREGIRLLVPIVGSADVAPCYELIQSTSTPPDAKSHEGEQGSIRICGVRSDGSVIVRERTSSPNASQELRYARPPSEVAAAENDSCSGDEIEVTLDGWELRWCRKGCELKGRRQAGDWEFCWKTAELCRDTDQDSKSRILDVIARPPQGGALVAVKHGQDVDVVMLSLPPDKLPGRRWNITKEDSGERIDIRFRIASGNLLVYKVIDHAEQRDFKVTHLNSVVELLDLNNGRTFSFDDNRPVMVRYLAAGITLVVRPPQTWRRFQKGTLESSSDLPGDVFVWSSQSEFRRSNLSFSREVRILERSEEWNESLVRIASVVERDGRWQLETSKLRIRDDAVVLDSAEKFELPLEARAWDRSENRVVLVYRNGRIEVRDCANLQTMRAIGYVPRPPVDVDVDVKLVRRSEGEFVVVSGVRLVWFRL